MRTDNMLSPLLRHPLSALIGRVLLTMRFWATAVVGETTGPPAQRDRHLALIREKGRPAWQQAVGYGKRALAETMMGGYKTLIGSRSRGRGFAA